MPSDRPHILISNDDGIDAPGIVALAAAAAARFPAVTVVAPATEQSGTSHALTLRRPVRVETRGPGAGPARPAGSGWFAVEGTPTDCVSLALFQLLPAAGRPDLVLSGINAGYNLGEDVTYSGTVAAALEARMAGVPSLAISTARDADPASLAAAAEVAVRLAAEVLARGLPEDALLNINVPPNPRGYRVTRQGRRGAFDGVIERPAGTAREFYFVGLPPSTWLHEDGADHAAVAEGFVSITPLHGDLTFHRARPLVEGWGVADWVLPTPPGRETR